MGTSSLRCNPKADCSVITSKVKQNQFHNVVKLGIARLKAIFIGNKDIFSFCDNGFNFKTANMNLECK